MEHSPADLVAVFASLSESDNTTYILSDRRTLVRWNAGWEEFARGNGGDDRIATGARGLSIFDVIAPPLHPFYAAGFDRACASGERWDHDYECSSSTLFRRFRMLAYPFGEMLVVTHRLIVERAHDRVAESSDPYRGTQLITMCSHCRCVRRPDDTKRWEWIPEFVAQMPNNITHGLCPPCVQYYYPEHD